MLDLTKIELKVYSTESELILVDLSEESATKFASYRGYDELLCDHVYFGFCPNCPQYRCRKRDV